MTRLKQGLIVSIQGFTANTINELAKEAINGGAIALRTDKKILIFEFPIIGLKKIKVKNCAMQAYITPTIEDIKEVASWADYVAIDYRKINPDLSEISKYCRANNIHVIADIGSKEDYKNIKEHDFYYDFIATTFSVLTKQYEPDIELARDIYNDGCHNLIAEGNIQTREQVRILLKMGIKYYCIGTAIANIYKLTRKFSGLDKDWTENKEGRNV